MNNNDDNNNVCQSVGKAKGTVRERGVDYQSLYSPDSFLVLATTLVLRKISFVCYLFGGYYKYVVK